MSKLSVTLQGREYFVNCDPGEEDRLREIVKFVDGKMQKVAQKAGAATVTETRLFMLTCLMLADELIESHNTARKAFQDNEDLMVAAVDHLRQRVAHIASQVGRA